MFTCWLIVTGILLGTLPLIDFAIPFAFFAMDQSPAAKSAKAATSFRSGCPPPGVDPWVEHYFEGLDDTQVGRILDGWSAGNFKQIGTFCAGSEAI